MIRVQGGAGQLQRRRCPCAVSRRAVVWRTFSNAAIAGALASKPWALGQWLFFGRARGPLAALVPVWSAVVAVREGQRAQVVGVS
jgi:hypothetical protein